MFTMEFHQTKYIKKFILFYIKWYRQQQGKMYYK